MSLITIILSLLITLEYLYIMYLGTVATQSLITARAFGLSQGELERESASNLFKNQGVYSGLIAVLLVYGIFTANATLVTVFLVNVVLVTLYGSLTADRKIILKQGGLAILALLTLLF